MRLVSLDHGRAVGSGDALGQPGDPGFDLRYLCFQRCPLILVVSPVSIQRSRIIPRNIRNTPVRDDALKQRLELAFDPLLAARLARLLTSFRGPVVADSALVAAIGPGRRHRLSA